MIARPGQRHHYGVGRRMRPPDAARRAFPPAEGDLVGGPIAPLGVIRRTQFAPGRRRTVLDGGRPDPGRPAPRLLRCGAVHRLGRPSAQPGGAPQRARAPSLGPADRRARGLLHGGGNRRARSVVDPHCRRGRPERPERAVLPAGAARRPLRAPVGDRGRRGPLGLAPRSPGPHAAALLR